MLLFTTAQKGWNELITHGIVEVAKALGGSFKLVTPTPKLVREMTQLPRETHKRMGTHKQIKAIQTHKIKPRLNIKNTLGPTVLYELVLVAVHMENFRCKPKCQGPLQLLSPPFLMTSTTKQMRPNGREGGRVLRKTP